MGNQQSWRVELRAQSADKLEIAVHDIIGSGFFEDGVTSKQFLEAIRSAPHAKSIDLRVNSIGGVVDEAKGMVNLLAERAASGVKITGYVDGIAASAASYLLTAAHHVVMPANSFQMLHQARGGVRGIAKDVEAYAEVLRRTTDQIAEGYAAASARRGKNKSKDDFLALFETGDTYLDADQAIEWGLADEKLESMKVAASLVDLGDLEEFAPAALKAAPYITPKTKTPEAKEAPRQLILPAIEARQAQTKENPNMKNITMALGLPETADEAAIVAQINTLKMSARVGNEIEKMVGALGDGAIGTVRALKESATVQASQAEEIAKVKATLARNQFDSIRDQGFADKKLTPALAKMYSDRFDKELVEGRDGSAIVDEIKAFLAVAPRLAALSGGAFGRQLAQQSEGGPLQYNGKTFAAMKPLERSQLSAQDPELYATMRQDWEAAGKPAA